MTHRELNAAPVRPFIWSWRMTRVVSLRPPSPPCLSPGWIAAYLAGLVCWLALYKLGGWFFVEVVAAAGLVLIGSLGRWVHTWEDRELPEARAVEGARR